MKKIFTTPVLVLASAIFFTIIFYNESIGVNLPVFELTLISIVLFVQKHQVQSRLSRFALAATLITAAAFVFNYSAFSLITNLISFFIWTGVLMYPGAKSLLTSIRLSFSNILLSIFNFFERIDEARGGKQGSLLSIVHYLKVLVFPILIVALFLLLYRISSPFFNEGFRKFMELLDGIDFNLVFVFVAGILISIFALIRQTSSRFIERDKKASLVMERVRIKIRNSKAYRLKREMVSAKFLLITLNILILVVNILDIRNVWFGFVWNGEYLKQFVHEGTTILIFSILISVGITLYFFRGNINFYKRSTLLKALAIAWMAQNALLAISVGIRNYWYISYFALAYRRIGVLVFLLLTLYGIYTVILKIKNRHTAFYLFRNNLMALLVVMIAISLVNWEPVIARYNFSHYKTAFIHFDFLSSFPGKAIPYLEKTPEELAEIDSYQRTLFRFKMKYMTSQEYAEAIMKKKMYFKKEWEEKGLWSWNYPEYVAYRSLTANDAAVISSR